jgi:very-short-patch-repair endonuclease
MARLFIRYRLPVPRAEVVWGHQREYRLDFAYPAIKLAIEVHGYVWHSSADQLGHDLARQRQLTSQGWTVLAYTWRQIVDDPEAVAAEIAEIHRRLSVGGLTRGPKQNP